MVKNEKSQKMNDQQEAINDEKSQTKQQETVKNAEIKNSSGSDEEEKSPSSVNHQENDIMNDIEANKNLDPMQEKLLELEKQNLELNDKYLRLFSEFDNYRKRSIKERQELTKTASAEITEAILPVLDDLERAHNSAVENPDIETLTEGINLILTKLKTTLKHKGLEEIENTIGESFNTDFHEAITHIPAAEEAQKGKIVDQVQKGYMLNGKIIRFAKVVVAN